MGASIENAKQPVVEQAIKGSWAWLLSYLLALVSLSASIATGVPGLRGLSGSAQALAWFHVSVFLSVFFIIVGSAIQIHLELRQVHSQLGVVRRAERSVEAELTNIQQVLSSDIRCEYVGDEEAAVRHLVGRFKQEALQAIRGTLVRSDEDHGQYAAAIYREIEDSLRDFLRRPETYLEEIVGPKADKKLVDAYINAAAGIEKDGGDRVGWFRLLDETPILNFVILTYKESGGAQKYEEVLFGGSRYGSETGEAVFRSKDPRVVHEFQDLYDVLRRSSARTEAKGVHERSVRASVIHQGWDQARLYKLMNGTEVCEAGQEGYNEGDLRISTTFFIGYFELRKEVLLGLSARGVRIKVLLMNPDNPDLMRARFGLRTDGLTPDKATSDLRTEIGRLAGYSNTEVRISDIMPCGFVAHSRNWAVVGMMPAHDSYVSGPMIETTSETPLWRMLQEDWKVRWEAARPYVATGS